ncbi:MAG: hypothetical protein U5Q44_03695 [Dehalococcoidia bacterium]|nr:hypothetical protein [Dehalococcoidia bacterium]
MGRPSFALLAVAGLAALAIVGTWQWQGRAQDDAPPSDVRGNSPDAGARQKPEPPRGSPRRMFGEAHTVVPALTAEVEHESATPAPGSGTPGRVTWQGEDWYLHGVNLPWYNWACDFGCGEDGGVVETAEVIAARLDGSFTNLRWWVFPGEDPWQLGDIAATYRDFDRALELAESHDLYYTFTLFSSSHAVDLGQPEAIVDALRPLFERYGDHPRIVSWEVFNEPEWQIWNGEVEESAVVDFTRHIVEAIHAYTSSYAAVGHATLDGIPMWDSVDLDYYQPHWYDPMDSGDWCALCTTADEVAERYGIDKPVVIGELYLGRPISMPVTASSSSTSAVTPAHGDGRSSPGAPRTA